MIGYLQGSEIKKIASLGANRAYYSRSSTLGFEGEITAVYFVVASDGPVGKEVAHQTMLSGEYGFPNVDYYTRRFGLKNSYLCSHTFERLIADVGKLVDGGLYRIV